ncbi:MAG: hypothetical protein V4537_06970 [Pseudomonadota bacterium]
MTLDETKAYLRLETAQDDALVARLVASAGSLCEAFLGQLLIRREVVETLPASGAWQRLGAAPVAAITGVVAVDAAGATSALPASAYAIDIDPAGDGWIRASGAARVRVTYRAGLADDAGAVPAAIGQGVVRLAAHLYAHRDAEAEPPAAIAALWRPFRRLRLGLETRA